jgi:hypothetical protein
MTTYDPRYLAGVLFFNRRDFFEAHEVWEDLWADSHGDDRKFIQGLLQAAVGLFHFSGGNLGGAVKLYHSSRAYMQPCGSPYWGLDADAFWRQMERCFAPLLTSPSPDRALRPDFELMPTLTLDPSPDEWPEPEKYVHEEES